MAQVGTGCGTSFKGVHSQLTSRYVELNNYGHLLVSDLPLHYRRGPAVNYSVRCKKLPPVPYCSTHSRGQRHSDGRVGNPRQRSLVTDTAPNMVACANLLNVCHIKCFAHMLNLVVKKSLSRTLDRNDICTNAWRIVAHFKSSTIANENLSNLASVAKQVVR